MYCEELTSCVKEIAHAETSSILRTLGYSVEIIAGSGKGSGRLDEAETIFSACGQTFGYLSRAKGSRQEEGC